jgi:CxxC motif-containing protein
MGESIRKEVVCIVCPNGCIVGNEVVKLTGNKCKKGIDFAKKEAIDPKRILTTTLFIDSINFKRVPVRSSKPVSKDSIFKIIWEVKKIKVKPVIKMGDVLAKNFMDTGVDIIASMDINE